MREVGDSMQRETCIIAGAGPCGMATAIALKKVGIEPLIIEKGNVVNALYRFPTHQTFFSTSDRLEIGQIPFITENRKPTRNQALAYYRKVAELEKLRINKYETVFSVQAFGTGFLVETSKRKYTADFVVLATGYYDHPNWMGVPGEDLPKVTHYFKEAHPYFDTDVCVIGGKNSAVDAAMELQKAGARVTVLYRGSDYSGHIKPWVLPEFVSLVKKGAIRMEFNTLVREITETTVIFEQNDQLHEIPNDFVFAMTGYRPDHEMLRQMGVKIEEETGRPFFSPKTMETNVPGIFIAGVIAAGNDANEIFIENGRFHGELIAREISNRLKDKR